MDSIHDRARGYWRSVLPTLGVSPKHLVNKHGPCPICGGKDRFRFDDKDGRGTWFCNHCGAGNGVDLVMKVKAVPFLEAVKIVEKEIGDAPQRPAPAKADTRKEADQKDRLAHLWGRSRPLDGADIASRYLANRGLQRSWSFVRYVPDLPYYEGQGRSMILPAMLAKFVAPDSKSSTLHRTFLAEPGKKAAIEKPRMMMPGRIPNGGAVRLAPAADIMGIGEGIESSMAASQIFSIPTWAATTAGNLLKWQPPREAKTILIFGDNDDNYVGQNAAYSLAYRLVLEKYKVEVHIPKKQGTDWNDFLTDAAIAA